MLLASMARRKKEKKNTENEVKRLFFFFFFCGSFDSVHMSGWCATGIQAYRAARHHRNARTPVRMVRLCIVEQRNELSLLLLLLLLRPRRRII